MSDADAAAGLTSKLPQTYQSCQAGEGDVEDPDCAAGRSRSFTEPLVLLPQAVHDELVYAWDGSVELMVDTIYPLVSWVYPGEKEEVVRQRLPMAAFVKYNPLWFLSVLVLAIFIVPGHLFHALIGNGENLRPDEQRVETLARVGWIYTYSGSFLLFGLGYALKLTWYVLTLSWNHNIFADMIAFSVVGLYVAGDAHLLFQMRRKNTMMTHACAISRVTFGLAFFFVLFVSLFHTCAKWEGDICWADINHFNFFVCCIFCLLMGIAAIGYWPLLFIDYKNKAVKHPPPPFGLWLSGFLSAFGPVAVTTILGVAATQGHFGDWPLRLTSVPFIVIIALPLLRMAVYGFAWERLWATLVALGPLILVTGSFSIAGPKLWSLLAG